MPIVYDDICPSLGNLQGSNQSQAGNCEIILSETE